MVNTPATHTLHPPGLSGWPATAFSGLLTINPPCCGLNTTSPPPCSGLLTIGPRFGGAIDDAARYFKQAADEGLEADAFVEGMKRRGIRCVCVWLWCVCAVRSVYVQQGGDLLEVR